MKLPVASICAFVIGMALWVDHLPFVEWAYVSPLSSLISVLFVPIVFALLRRVPSNRIFYLATLLISYLIAQGTLARFYLGPEFFGIDLDTLLATFARQVIALVTGYAVFFVVYLLSYSGYLRSVLYGIALVGVLSAMVAFRQSGFTMDPFARASGLAAEPAHLSTIIVTLGLPAYLWLMSRKKIIGYLGWLLSITSLVLSQSTVGMVLVTIFIAVTVLLGQSRKVITKVLTIAALAITTMTLLWIREYTRKQVVALLHATPTVSFWDRVGGAMGGFLAWINDPVSLVGYGLGRHGFRIEVFMPTGIADEILRVKGFYPGLNSLLGRIMVDGGIIGALIFIYLSLLATYRLFKLIKKYPNTKFIMPGWISTIIAVTIGGQGSFAAPYFWLWLGVIGGLSARYATCRKPRRRIPFQYSRHRVARDDKKGDFGP